MRTWHGVLALIGTETGDRRMIMSSAEVNFRSRVGFLNWQRVSTDGHNNSVTIGGYRNARVEGGKVIVDPGDGFFLDTPEALEVQQLIETDTVRPSVDMDSVDGDLIDGDTGEPLDWDRMWEDADYEPRIVEGWSTVSIAGATLVAHSAFADVQVFLGEDTDEGKPAPALVAAATAAARGTVTTGSGAATTVRRRGISASGFPVAYSTEMGYTVDHDEWLSAPDLPLPFGIHRTDEGRVQGYICERDSLHLSEFWAGRNVTPPRTQCDYQYFRGTELHTPDGVRAVGKLVVGGGHVNDLDMGWMDTQRCYDDTATTWALVAVGDDDFGTWVSGYVLDSAPLDTIAAGLSATYSGDWRAVPGYPDRELVAAVGVNLGAFPQKRRDSALVASPGVRVGLGMSAHGATVLRGLTGFGAVPAELHPLAEKRRARLTAAAERPARRSIPTAAEIAAEVVGVMDRRAAVAKLRATVEPYRNRTTAQTRSTIATIRTLRSAR